MLEQIGDICLLLVHLIVGRTFCLISERALFVLYLFIKKFPKHKSLSVARWLEQSYYMYISKQEFCEYVNKKWKRKICFLSWCQRISNLVQVLCIICLVPSRSGGNEISQSTRAKKLHRMQKLWTLSLCALQFFWHVTCFLPLLIDLLCAPSIFTTLVKRMVMPCQQTKNDYEVISVYTFRMQLDCIFALYRNMVGDKPG